MYRLKEGVDLALLEKHNYQHVPIEHGRLMFVKAVDSYTDGVVDTYYGIIVDVFGDRVFKSTKNTGVIGMPPVKGVTKPIGLFSRHMLDDLIKEGIVEKCGKKDLS